MGNLSRYASALLLSSACLGTGSAALAQAAPTPPAEPTSPPGTSAGKSDTGAVAGGIDEIVVTARKTNESLQRTPVAVTALNTAELEHRQIGNVADVQRVTPNIQIITGAPATPGFTIIAMRGEYNLNANSEADPAIALYLDGVYIARDAGSLLNLTDLERVEVLRGPQGTLFGRNTTGGAINVVTAKPTGVFEGYLQGTIGNYGDHEGAAMLNVPIVGDEVDARFNYQYREHGGYAHDVTTNQPLNDQKGDNLVRGQLKIAPAGQDWRFLLSADYDHNSDSGQLNTLVAVNPLSALALLPAQTPGGPRGIASLAPFIQTSSNWYTGYGSNDTATNPAYFAHEYLTTYGASGTFDADMGAVNLKSITAYRNLDTAGFNNLAGTPDPARILFSTSHYLDEQFSQELQLSGEVGRLRWIGGAYYFTEWGTELSQSDAFGFLRVPVSMNFGDFNNSSEAVFAQGYYKLTDRLTATAGLRYTWDQRDVVIHNENPYDYVTDTGGCTATGLKGVHPAQCNTPENADFSYPAWTAGLDFQATPTILLYAKTSGASMAGGWNLRVNLVPAYFPETVRDVEGGIKADWFDHRLRTDLAVFHSWKGDIQQQVSQLVNGVSTLYEANGGSAQINGLELESTVAPWTGMQVTGGLGWMNGRYDKGSFIDNDKVGGVLFPVDRSGEPLLQFPKVTFNIGATQAIPLSFGRLTVHLDYSWSDAVHFYSLTAAPQQTAAVAASYAQANALAVLRARGLLSGVLTLSLDDVDISLWGKNLTGTKYLTWGLPKYAAYGSTLGIETGFVGDPMTFGVTVKVPFGGR